MTVPISMPDGETGQGRTDDGADLTWPRRRDVLASGAAVAACALSLGAHAQVAGGDQGQVVRIRTSFTINGADLSVEVDPRQSILDLLRETLELTGTKKGCNQGACGACTILLNGRRVNACLTLAAMHDGANITTIEGLATGGELHPLQAAFIEHDAFQCGYCTPGQLLSGVACIDERHAGSAEEIKAWMSGNICRCGAYAGIVAAIADVAGRT